MPLHSIPVARCARTSSKGAFLPGTSIPKASAKNRPSRPSVSKKVAAVADADKVAEVLQSVRFKEALRPLRKRPRGSKTHCTSYQAAIANRLHPQRPYPPAAMACRAECEPAQEGTGLKIIVVSTAFEGKTAKRREKLVLQALQEDEPDGVTIMAMTPCESAAMLKKWC